MFWSHGWKWAVSSNTKSSTEIYLVFSTNYPKTNIDRVIYYLIKRSCKYLQYIFRLIALLVDSDPGYSLDLAIQVYKESDCTSFTLSTEMRFPFVSVVSVTFPG